MFSILFCLLILLCPKAKAQQEYSLKIELLKENDFVVKFPYKRNFQSPQERDKELRTFLFTLYDNAYIAASFDSLVEDSTSLHAYLNTGKMYKWASLQKGNVDEGIISEIGFREKLYSNKPLYFKDVRKVQERILNYCENNGYPFATVRLDSIQFADNLIFAQLKLVKSIKIQIDSIIIDGTATIAPVYLYSYLNIKQGDAYNESLIRQISTRLKELPFIRESKTPTVIFAEKTTKLVLFLDKKKSSQFDGIVGILPDDNSGRIKLSGDVHLKLQNAFGRGELIDFNWRKLQANTQDLNSHFSYPFLFSTPFGIDYSLKLYKKDTLFIDLNQNIGIQYILTGGNYLKAFLNTKKSTLLSTKGLETQTTLPANADINTSLYGLGYKTEHLDYRLNPKKGITLNVNAAAGNRNIKRNAKLNPVIYENLKLRTVQYHLDMEFASYLPVAHQSTIKLAVQSAYLYSGSMFQNELFRIGGFKTLRGFDEESINASAYSILTMEYRYLLEQNSYLYFFFDGAYYENKSVNFSGDRFDMLFGFGSGISFETKAGIFSISYALGKQFNNPIYLKYGKVHFGILNYF